VQVSFAVADKNVKIVGVSLRVGLSAVAFYFKEYLTLKGFGTL
jgi:hypothetical protein